MLAKWQYNVFVRKIPNALSPFLILSIFNHSFPVCMKTWNKFVCYSLYCYLGNQFVPTQRDGTLTTQIKHVTVMNFSGHLILFIINMIDNIYNMFPFMDVNFMGILWIEKVLFKKFSQLNLWKSRRLVRIM